MSRRSDVPPRGPRSEGGFTLLEIIMALALAALLLVALNTFVFSMAELWGRSSQTRLFDQHVNAVTRFLQSEMRIATLPPVARANATPVTPQQITPQNGAMDNLITFDLPAGCRVITWDGPPLPEVVCSLQVRNHEGLYLLWHSRLEVRFADDPPRETLLTPYVTAMAYDYYDDNFKKWTTETALRPDPNGAANAAMLAPQRLRLTFAYAKLKPREVTIPIPAALPAMPNF